MLNFTVKENTWEPPYIEKSDMEALTGIGERSAHDSREEFLILRTEPYIDTLYIRYANISDVPQPEQIKRFTFHEGYGWGYRREQFFLKHCVRNMKCCCDFMGMNDIYDYYSEKHPEWHLNRYYTRPMKLFDHIYHCMKQNTVKEMLYKAGLDELAYRSEELDEINLLAGKPSDIFEGLTIRTLRALNSYEGADMVNQKRYRLFLTELQKAYPAVFDEKMNAAQCKYLRKLIDGDLTVGETGRLYLARKKELVQLWCETQYEILLKREGKKEELNERATALRRLDPIYRDYLEAKTDDTFVDIYQRNSKLVELERLLVREREEYDRRIRRSNRKRNYDWQERNHGYIIRFPQTINDFCREAIYMQNCLLTYLEAFIQGDTTILLMHKPEDINRPYIAIEIFDNELKQAYRRFNEDCSEDEADWIRAYCRRHDIYCGHFKFCADEDDLF